MRKTLRHRTACRLHDIAHAPFMQRSIHRAAVHLCMRASAATIARFILHPTMRITDIREHAIPISRYADPAIASGGLTTSIVAVITDVVRDGRPVTGYGYASVGRHAQGGLIRGRFAPRLLAGADAIADDTGINVDPFRAWQVIERLLRPDYRCSHRLIRARASSAV